VRKGIPKKEKGLLRQIRGITVFLERKREKFGNIFSATYI